MKRIHDSLRQVLGRHRLVFWYDGTGDWKKEFEAFAAEGIEKVQVENNELGEGAHPAPSGQEYAISDLLPQSPPERCGQLAS